MEKTGLVNHGSTEGLREALHADHGVAPARSEPADISAGLAAVVANENVSRRPLRVVLILLVVAATAGAFFAIHSSRRTSPRTEVLRSASPLSDIWIRITGPGGAVSYVGHRFLTGGAFSRFTLRHDPTGGLFMPPPIRGQKLCASTHVIQPGDASQLQEWQGRRLAITIYGKKSSAIYCAVLGYGLYLG